MYFVIQTPTVQEDEGRYFLVGWKPKLDDAYRLRDKLCTDSLGYKKPGDFVIVNEVNILDQTLGGLFK